VARTAFTITVTPYPATEAIPNEAGGQAKIGGDFVEDSLEHDGTDEEDREGEADYRIGNFKPEAGTAAAQFVAAT